MTASATKVGHLPILQKDSTKIYLEPASGEVIPYEGSDIPSVLENALKKSEAGSDIGGFSSGGRSAILQSEGNIYKLKGIIPSNRVYNDCLPFGCLKENSSLNELKTSKFLYKFGLKKGVEAPMSPVCHFKYDIIFDDENVSCCVHEVGGDRRFTGLLFSFGKVISDLFDKGLRDKDRISELREQLTNKAGKWAGFWYGALESADLSWGTTLSGNMVSGTNVGSHNMVFYSVEDGVGIGLVDLTRSERNPSNEVREFELNKIKSILASLDGTLYFLENAHDSLSVESYNINEIFRSGCTNIEVFKDDYDWFNRLGGIGDLGIPVPKTADLEIIEHFKKGRRGEIPEPIDREFFTDTKRKITSVLKGKLD